ncbi:uncharacterized protein LOC143824826 [Paroedura picta]|uniref:uncharacterized protein LOC143824826 n=1 Tax=Paroedura picta TaxID=143630 RepID=UPI0040561889
MPGWNIIDQDGYGHLVAKLSVSLADPEAEVREKAREVIGQLLRLQQKEQGRSKKTISWEEDPERPWMESYAHLTAAAEVFGGPLSERQRLSFQEAALEDALSLDGRWVREGGRPLGPPLPPGPGQGPAGGGGDRRPSEQPLCHAL